MRLFVGVELDDATRAAAAGVAERLRRRLQRVAPDLRARWIAPPNLHITIWFIGEVPDDRAAGISEALNASPAATKAFDLALAGCGAFPPSGPPRVFWVGVRHGGAQMRELYGEVGERLAPFGYVPERRAYTAHLTLAKVQDAQSPSKAIREAVASIPSDCGSCRISFLTLFRSRLSPRGASYEPLLRVPLL